jgi:hypothetical protein
MKVENKQDSLADLEKSHGIHEKNIQYAACMTPTSIFKDDIHQKRKTITVPIGDRQLFVDKEICRAK